jgi:hypothetical protein
MDRPQIPFRPNHHAGMENIASGVHGEYTAHSSHNLPNKQTKYMDIPLPKTEEESLPQLSWYSIHLRLLNYTLRY